MSLDRVTAGRDLPEDFNVIIEIPMNADPIKYEVDKQTGALFVKRGEEYRPAEILLGKDADVAPNVCTPSKARS